MAIDFCVLRVFAYPKIYEDVLICFLLEMLSFYILCLGLSVVHLKLTFMYGARWSEAAFFSHIEIQLTQWYLLKEPFFPHCLIMVSFS